MTRNAHRNVRLRRYGIALAVVLVGMLAVRWALDARAADVYVICMDCGLERAETDDLIDTMRESDKIQTRAELLAAYAATFDAPPADRSVPCGNCAEAVLDAAGIGTG